MTETYTEMKDATATVSSYMYEYYDDSEDYIDFLKSYLQANGYDQEERDFAANSLSSSSSLSSLFTPNEVSAAEQALANTAVAMGRGSLRDLSKVYSLAGERLIAQTLAAPNSFGAALTKTLVELVQPANDNPDLKIFNKAKALGRIAGAFGLSYIAMEVILAENPQSEAIKQGSIFAVSGGLGWGVSAFAAGVLGAPAVLASGAGAAVIALSSFVMHENWSAIYNTATNLKALGKSALEITEQLMDDFGDFFDAALALTGSAMEDFAEGLEAFGQELIDDASEALLAAKDGLIAAINDAVADVVDLFSTADVQPSPLVFDIDGGGVQLVSVESANAVYYDLSGDGFGTATGWTAGGDGFLAIDLNEDGVINNGTELFGDQSGYANGFEALAAYDSNGDGLITSADDNWENLLVWVDANGNGFSEASELYSLGDLNITSISLAYTQTNYAIGGNNVYQQSTFTMNGASRTVVDAYFSINTTNTTYVGDYTLDPAALLLPVARGYGQLPDLHIAASLDNDQQDSGSLISLLIDFNDLDMSDIFAADAVAMDAIRSIMFRWAGVEDVNPISRGPNVDARELGFLEALTGQPFLQSGHSSNPFVEAGRFLSEAFQIAQSHFYATLVAQTEARDLFTGSACYNIATDSFEGVTGIDTDVLDELEIEASALATSAERAVFWKNIVRLIEYTVGTDNLDNADYTALEDAISSDLSLSLSIVLNNLLDTDPLNVILGTSGNDTLDGTVWNDEISGGTGNDTLSGLAGNDVLIGGSDNDVLIGGSGDDFMNGGWGDDIYIYHLGDGTDIITEVNGNGFDKILFGPGIALNDLIFTRLGNDDLEIRIDTGTETGKIMIAGQFSHVQSVVEQIEFDDSSTLDLTTVDYMIYSVGHNLTLLGVEIGGGNNDTIIAGAGLDDLRGRSGNDTYVFGLGAAQVFGVSSSSASYSSIVEYDSQGTDTLHITDGVDADDVRMWTGQYGELYVQYSATDIIYIQGGMNGYGESLVGQKLEKIVFDDTTEWDLTQGLHLRNNDTARTIYGTTYDDVIQAGAGGDNLYGRTGADTLIAGAGKDNLYGGAGSDTYVFGLGDAQVSGSGLYTTDYSSVVEYASEGTDTLHITDTVDPDDVRLWTGQYGGLYVQYSATDIIYIQGGMNGYGESLVGQRLEKIVFDDATEWDLTQGLHLHNNDTARTIYGSAYDDVIQAGAGGDNLYGRTGADTLVAGSGKDNLYGGAGADTYVFGLGDAQVSGSGLYTTDYSSVVEYASEGTDTLHITDAVDADDVRMWTGQYGGLYVQYSATDVVYIQGGMSGYGGSLVGERLEKIVFDDTTEWDLTQGLHLRNNDTARTLYGSTQNDVIEGGAGGDALYGYGGDDILMGRGGSDNLFGGAGADTFVFLADDVGDGIDTLNDFNVTDGDKIDLRDVLDAGYDPVTDALADFVQFTNSGSNSTLSVDMDGAGTTYGWTQIATIYNHTNLDPDAMVTAGQLLVA